MLLYLCNDLPMWQAGRLSTRMSYLLDTIYLDLLESIG